MELSEICFTVILIDKDNASVVKDRIVIDGSDLEFYFHKIKEFKNRFFSREKQKKECMEKNSIKYFKLQHYLKRACMLIFPISQIQFKVVKFPTIMMFC